MSDLLTYPVLAALRHNGTRYAPDDPECNTVDLSHREARPLKNLKIIGESVTDSPSEDQADPDTATGQSGTEPAASNETAANNVSAALTGDVRAEKIADAIGALDKDTDFTQAGLPKVKAVEKAAGFDMTADEVAAVWATMKVSGKVSG